MDYSHANKKEQIMINSTTCNDLKNVMSSERSQTRKKTYCIILFI